MQHRHLNGSDLSLAAIDDIIENGSLGDWFDLALHADRDPQLRSRIRHLAGQTIHHSESPGRPAFWLGLYGDAANRGEMELT